MFEEEEKTIQKYIDALQNKYSKFVLSRGGKHTIERLLIATNGIAAVKGIRSIRTWLYENFQSDRVITFVAMAIPEDLKSNAEYIRLADEVVHVKGGSNVNNYANVETVISVAKECKVDAVFAGWGHASENPNLARRLMEENLIWLGPNPDAMRALGDKIESSLIAQNAGVPCLPWSGQGIKIDFKLEEGVPSAAIEKSCVSTTEEALKRAKEVGFPLMIKASEGGGGKGIRLVAREADMEKSFKQVQTEVPGSNIFLMKLGSDCRHLEVQLLGDKHGTAISLFGRDCSIQRRHQKIIEEGPVVSTSKETWREMERAAERLARKVGYIGAGTVEYLYQESTGKFWFLELNPRLQVEHPVTELISGINLPALMLQVSMGIPLVNMKGIRRLYNLPEFDPKSNVKHDLNNLEKSMPFPRHVIACRITAEDPKKKFQPTTGRIEEVNFLTAPGVFGYFSVSNGGSIHEFADSQFGHLFAIGETREIARRNMSLALKRLKIRGEISTTVEFLRHIIENNEFIMNRISTTWLEGLMEKESKLQKINVHVAPKTSIIVLLGAVIRAHMMMEFNYNSVMEDLKLGRTIGPSNKDLLSSEIKFNLIYSDVKYSFAVSKTAPDAFSIQINGNQQDVTYYPLSDGGLLIKIGLQSHVVHWRESRNGSLKMIRDGLSFIFPEEVDPTVLAMGESSGKFLQFVCKEGDYLDVGAVYAEIEVMKMVVELRTAAAGKIHLESLDEGSTLAPGDRLATLELDEAAAEKVKKITNFEGALSVGTTPTHRESMLKKEAEYSTDNLKRSRKTLTALLQGFGIREHQVDFHFNRLIGCLKHGGNTEAGIEILSKFLSEYIKYEEPFALNRAADQSDEAILTKLRRSNKTDLEYVHTVAQSHMQVSLKNHFMVLLLGYMKKHVSHLLLANQYLGFITKLVDFRGEIYESISKLAYDLLLLCSVDSPRDIKLPMLSRSQSSSEIKSHESEHDEHDVDFFSRKRQTCEIHHTTYCYDFALLFENELKRVWKRVSNRGESKIDVPEDVFSYKEFFLDPKDSTKLLLKKRKAGSNDVGMVGFLYKMKTPRHPNGREVVVLSNDITFLHGTFGPAEDKLFALVTKYAASKGLPRIYINANSGARIGVAQEILDVLQIAFVDQNGNRFYSDLKDQELNAGAKLSCDYLYLKKSDYEKLGKYVQCHKMSNDRYKLEGIIGRVDGLGVENLSYSGLIAGETSRAYEKCFTLSYVSGRSVGIGAYLVRLGQRVIQKTSAPILLTGYNALNKLLSRKVYFSNNQLGGTDVMGPNGVSHLIVSTDTQGINRILEWLSFIPSTNLRSSKLFSYKFSLIPENDPFGATSLYPYSSCLADGTMSTTSILTSAIDPIDRIVKYVPPPKGEYDARCMIAGTMANAYGSPTWVGGLFDKGSFKETLQQWAKSVIVGRAELGGIPCGVITPSTGTTEQLFPADPADLESQETVRYQAGQVWYPDSSYKTAQAIRDFNREELPLFIIANWRGFSGGMRDMYGEILKFGSYIVDALTEYTQPVFVYIPENGELRGGAWVVLDRQINPEYMEMYCAENSRGGVLEPTGTLDVKFNKGKRSFKRLSRKFNPFIQRRVSVSASITEEQEDKEAEPGHDSRPSSTGKHNFDPVCTSILTKFIDLHDNPIRMTAKGCVRKVVPWGNSRKYFFWRLRRRLCETFLYRMMKPYTALTSVTMEQCIAHVAKLLRDNKINEESDKDVVNWLEGNGSKVIYAYLKQLNRNFIEENFM